MTSSLKSATHVISILCAGIIASKPLSHLLISIPTCFKTSNICSSLNVVPKRLLIFSHVKGIFNKSWFITSYLIIALSSWQSHNSLTHCAARFKTYSCWCGLIPLTNLELDSLIKFNLIDVFLIEAALKYAASITIFLVFSSTAQASEPITPPKHIGFPSLQITRSPFNTLYVCSSSATKSPS